MKRNCAGASEGFFVGEGGGKLTLSKQKENKNIDKTTASYYFYN